MNRIVLFARRQTKEVLHTLTTLCDYLSKLGITVFLEEETAQLFDFSFPISTLNKYNLRLDSSILRVPLVDEERATGVYKNINEDRERRSQQRGRSKCEEYNCDLIIVVGGDGSMLNCAPIAAMQNLPVLGVNRGRLGFLADIYPEDLEKIAPILNGEYREEQRVLLKTQLFYNDKILLDELFTNDSVLSLGGAAKLVDFTLNIDGDYVCDYRADGLIVATSTGSTAYALSGGGPIIHPNLDAIEIVPMFAHNLSVRPLVIKDTSSIEVVISEDNTVPLGVSCDGRANTVAPPGSKMIIRKSPLSLRLIHPLEYNYFSTLREKINL